jgi:glycosyltransferase involved in cell wall biosynthesis
MNVLLLCKRFYTNRDLIKHRFGRLYHVPKWLGSGENAVFVLAFDYKEKETQTIKITNTTFKTLSLAPIKLLGSLRSTWNQTRLFQPDVVIASGDSHIGFFAMHVARNTRSKFVFDVYDYYPSFRSNRLPGMKSMFWHCLRRADLVLCASERLSKMAKPFNPQVMLLENGVDENLFRPLAQDQARSRLGLPHDAFIIGYFGSVAPHRGPLLFEAADKLRSVYPNLILLMAGTVSGVRIPQKGSVHLGALDQELIPGLIAATDVVTIPYAQTPFNDMSGPCKLAEYLACQRPVVATTAIGTTRSLENSTYVLCEPSVESLASAIQTQLTNPQKPELPGSLKWSAIGKALEERLSRLL